MAPRKAPAISEVLEFNPSATRLCRTPAASGPNSARQRATRGTCHRIGRLVKGCWFQACSWDRGQSATLAGMHWASRVRAPRRHMQSAPVVGAVAAGTAVAAVVTLGFAGCGNDGTELRSPSSDLTTTTTSTAVTTSTQSTEPATGDGQGGTAGDAGGAASTASTAATGVFQLTSPA